MRRECITYQGYEGTCLRCNKPLDEHPPKDFPNLLDVLRELKLYDRKMAALAPEWEKVETERDVARLALEEASAETLVRMAFWKATKDRNNWGHCRVADIDYIRELSKRWHMQQHEPGCFYPVNGMQCSCTPGSGYPKVKEV